MNFTENLSRKYREFHISPFPTHAQTLPSPHTQSITCVIMDQPTLKHLYPPKPIVFIRVHSLYCSFYRF